LQQNARIRGSKDFFFPFAFVFAFPVSLDLGLVVDKNGPPLITRGVNFDAIKFPIFKFVVAIVQYCTSAVA
jgi:hypothetical protein